MCKVYVRCGACDSVLASKDISNSYKDDLCSICRYVVKKSVEYHYYNIAQMENEVWRVQMGSYEEQMMKIKDGNHNNYED